MMKNYRQIRPETQGLERPKATNFDLCAESSAMTLSYNNT